MCVKCIKCHFLLSNTVQWPHKQITFQRKAPPLLPPLRSLWFHRGPIKWHECDKGQQQSTDKKTRLTANKCKMEPRHGFLYIKI